MSKSANRKRRNNENEIPTVSKKEKEEEKEKEKENETETEKEKEKGKGKDKEKFVVFDIESHRNKQIKEDKFDNIFKQYRNYEKGLPCTNIKRHVKNVIINYCKTFKLYKVESPFDRRVTFIVWHPTNPRLLSVTSHGGDVVLYNYEQDINDACIIKGIGAGGSVQNMKFDPTNPIQLYTVSMEGKFLVLNFHTKKATQFLETNDINRWYVSLDVNFKNNLMVAGDTKGGLTLLTCQGEVTDTVQLHKKGCKVSHAEFSKQQPWLLCTSSTDGTIKFWDIRNLRSEFDKSVTPLQCIKHLKPLNAAYFSLTDGTRLLTTDQYDKVMIYRAPLWDLETIINHPHRQFQHLTPIKAYWHPLEDIVVVGRYPHSKFPGYHQNELRTLDFFDAETGELLHQHHQSGFDGILSLNRFNILGDALASSYGQRFLIWRPDFKQLDKMSRIRDNSEKNGGSRGGDSDDDDDNDDDDDDEFDWKAYFKAQAKEKRKKKEVEKKKV